MKVIVENLVIEYQSKGSGEVLLILHGWGDSSSSFNNLSAKLSNKYKVVTFDLPGFGTSDTPSTSWTVKDYAAFVVEFCAKLKLKPKVIVGHSMGGRIAIKLIGNGMLEAQYLVLLATAGIKQSSKIRSKAYKAVAKTGKFTMGIFGLSKGQKSMRARLYKSAGSTDYLQAGAMQQTFINIINEDLQSTAKMITIPTLLIYGQDDTETPPYYGKVFQQEIEGSQLNIIAGKGHFLQLEAINEVVHQIEEFIK